MNPKWYNSKCPSGLWLHDFQHDDQYPRGLLQTCTRCGTQKFFDNNDTYARYHMRQFLQPSMPEFEYEYGK